MEPEERMWEPLRRLTEDIPNVVRDFLQQGVPQGQQALLSEAMKLGYIKRLTSTGGMSRTATPT